MINILTEGGAFLGRKKPLTIVLVTLHRIPNDDLITVSPTPSGVCTIKLANAEITFQNGGEERIIQTIMRELCFLQAESAEGCSEKYKGLQPD